MGNQNQSSQQNNKRAKQKLPLVTAIQQNEQCNSVIFNQDASVFIAGCNNKINAFQFKKGILKKIYQLNQHKGTLLTLNYMRRSKNFVSGSRDDSIIIWQSSLFSKPLFLQKLSIISNGLKGVLCLIINNNEDLIISGYQDSTIKFWKKKSDSQQWFCFQIIDDHKWEVFALSLNDAQNMVISCGYDQFLLVIQQQTSNEVQKWITIQKIQIENFGCRLCFIDNSLFIFQPYQSSKLLIYEYNNKTILFKQNLKPFRIEGHGQPCASLFPQLYIKQQHLLISKNGYKVNFIKLSKDNEDIRFILDFILDFQDNCIYGNMSDNGDYFATWDEKSKEIQIREYRID